MQFFYNLLTWLLLPVFASYWLLRAVVNHNYRPRIGQRFGFGYPKLESCIWVHAVSVGEVQASVPLIRALAKRFPDHEILVTTVTPTGATRVRAVFGDSVTHSYIPFEIPTAIRAFFTAVDPDIALVMETEIWPNMYRGCGIRDIPLVLVSARVSPKSVPGYQRLLPLIRETLSHGIIAAQSEADAERFLSLGAAPERTSVTGNIKFDIELDDDIEARGASIRRELFGERPVWIAASTHEGEEQVVLDAHKQLLRRHPELLLVLVPRHPERFATVRERTEIAGLPVVSRTDGRSCDTETRVFLCDTMGELPMFYAASDIAFVAGSLMPIGGHNLLEPAALAKPVISGPHVFNAQDIADMFVANDACYMVRDADELAAAVAELLEKPDRAATVGRNAYQIVEANRGSLGRLLVLLEPLISEIKA